MTSCWSGRMSKRVLACWRHMHSRGRETNSTKIQALANSVKFLHILRSGVRQDIPFKVKDRLVHDAATTRMKEAQWLLSLLGLWMQHIPHLGKLLQLIYQAMWKVPALSMALRREWLCSRSSLQNKQPCRLEQKSQHTLWYSRWQ